VTRSLSIQTKTERQTIMKHSALCLVDTESQADAIVGKLRSAGFSDNDISVLFPDKGSTRDFAHKKETKMPEGATVGASAGGALGGTIGLLAGIGAWAIPGLGPFIAAGPIIAALSGGAIGAGVGGLTGALIGLGIPEYEAKRYEGKVKEGGILISVHSENNAETSSAKVIFKEEGAYDISSTGEAHAGVKAQDSSDVMETGVDEPLPTENIATSQVVETEKRAPKMEGDSIATLEQIQLRAYFIAERRKNFGVGGDESEDWAQAERELRAEANLLQNVH
jgi:Protein of unknown function (DUF2934)